MGQQLNGTFPRIRGRNRGFGRGCYLGGEQFSLQTPDLEGKRLQLFKEALPNLTRVAVLIDAAGRPHSHEIDMKSAETAAHGLNVGLGPVAEVQRPEEIEGALATLAKEAAVDGVLVIGGTMVFANRAELAGQALKTSLICGLREEAEAGCLMAYGPNLTVLFRRAADLVDKILKGAAPGELPVEQPTTFELIVNLKTAKALGLTIAPHVLAVADEVIEWGLRQEAAAVVVTHDPLLTGPTSSKRPNLGADLVGRLCQNPTNGCSTGHSQTPS